MAGGSPLRGERNLEALLANLHPTLDPVGYAFCRVGDGQLPPALAPLGTFRESEGLTVILPSEAAAAAGLRADFSARRITLRVHSDLAAVGLTARVATALAAAGIPCNVVAAAYHDHLFVPEGEAERALAVLEGLTREAGPDREVSYTVTVEVDADIATDWLDWMRQVHVPEVLASGCFRSCEVSRRHDPPPPEGTLLYVLEYRAPSLTKLAEYRAEHAPALQRAHLERYGVRARASRAVDEALFTLRAPA